jgi:hypothetical protein
MPRPTPMPTTNQVNALQRQLQQNGLVNGVQGNLNQQAGGQQANGKARKNNAVR